MKIPIKSISNQRRQFLFSFIAILFSICIYPLHTAMAQGTSVAVSLPSNATGSTGNPLTIPVTIGAVPAGQSIESVDFTVFFDPAVLQSVTPFASNAGTLSAGCSLLANSTAPGRVIISLSCGGIGAPITTATGGTLVNLQFNVIGTAGQRTGLLFANPTGGSETVLLNGGDLPDNSTGGLFTVLGPTASSVSVFGRAMTASGRGITNVLITLTDSKGNQRTAKTTSFGYYRFENVEAGDAVTITAKARRFRFSQPTIVRTTDDQISDANFVAVD